MSAGKLLGTLLFAAPVAHMKHLSTRSLAEHLALGDLYEGLPGKVDALAEAIQGCEGLIEEWPAPEFKEGEEEEAAEFVAGLQVLVEEGRDELPDRPEIQNLVDDLLAWLSGIHYRLEFLS